MLMELYCRPAAELPHMQDACMTAKSDWKVVPVSRVAVGWLTCFKLFGDVAASHVAVKIFWHVKQVFGCGWRASWLACMF
jgi:hypothetical protein